ncbi:MAG TPA: hypothetical protein VNE63_15420 [Candidatus Acidoferrales bacterium]|nr:hypothetical protein [Candidatus Acidoferrales bacterium]
MIAEDIRRLPLVFLWVRTILKGEHNIHIVHGWISDPRLPVAQVDEVLIMNTYHELADTQSILAYLSSSFVPGGRLVIADREPKPASIGVTELSGHEIAAASVANDLRSANFQIVKVEDPLVENDADRETWLMIVARKPLPPS